MDQSDKKRVHVVAEYRNDLPGQRMHLVYGTELLVVVDFVKAELADTVRTALERVGESYLRAHLEVNP